MFIDVAASTTSTTFTIPNSMAGTDLSISLYDLAIMLGRSPWAARCMEREISNRVAAGKRVDTQLRRLGIR